MSLNKFIGPGDIVIRAYSRMNLQLVHVSTKYKVVWVEGKWAWIRLQDVHQSGGYICLLTDLALTTA